MPRDERLEARPSERKGDCAPPVVQRHAAGAQLLGAAIAFIPRVFCTTSYTADEPSFAALSAQERGEGAQGRGGADREDGGWQRDEEVVTRRWE
eukprot:scaffold92835_cov66-Phaeocystis_antarctica.AAC.5